MEGNAHRPKRRAGDSDSERGQDGNRTVIHETARLASWLTGGAPAVVRKYLPAGAPSWPGKRRQRFNKPQVLTHRAQDS